MVDMASIVKRGNKYAVVYYEGEGSNKHQVWESGLSYTQAKARKAELNYLISKGTQVDSHNMTVSEFMKVFVEQYGQKKWTASTYQGNIGLLENYILPYFGHHKLRNVKTKTVDDFYDLLLNEAEPVANMGKPTRKHVTASVIRDVHKLLRCAFNKAIKWEYILKNPCVNATLPEYHEKEREFLTPTQLQIVLDYTDKPDDFDLYTMHCAIQLAFACCMRGGEIGGAEWNRFNFNDNTLFIDRVIDRIKKEFIDKLNKINIYYKFPNLMPGASTIIVLKDPKTKDSVRKAFVPEAVMQKLLRLREMQMKIKQELGDDGYIDYGLIICQANGRPIMTEHLNSKFKKVLEDLESAIPNHKNIVFHSLRHTSACVKLKLSNGDLKTVQGDGGWSSSKMITDRYSHIIEEDRKVLAEKMNNTFYKEMQGSQNKGLDAVIEVIRTDEELLRLVIEKLKTANNI